MEGQLRLEDQGTGNTPNPLATCTYSVRYWSDKYRTLYVQFWAPDDGRKNRLKHVQRLTKMNKLWNFASCWLYSANTTNNSRLGCASPLLVQANNNRKDVSPDETAVRPLYSYNAGWFSNSLPHSVDSFLRQRKDMFRTRILPHISPAFPHRLWPKSWARNVLNVSVSDLWNGWFYP